MDYQRACRLLQEHQREYMYTCLLLSSFLFSSLITSIFLHNYSKLRPLPPPSPPPQSIVLLSPGVVEYAGERCLLNCFPVLYSHGIADLSKAPCLSALLKNLHHILLDQYTYEEVSVWCTCTYLHHILLDQYTYEEVSVWCTCTYLHHILLDQYTYEEVSVWCTCTYFHHILLDQYTYEEVSVWCTCTYLHHILLDQYTYEEVSVWCTCT